MPAELMDGRAVAAALLDETRARAADALVSTGRRPCLATVLVGDDPASHTYVRMKASRCREVGIESRRLHLPGTSGTGDVVAAVRALSDDAAVDGILLQHPVPRQVDERAAFEAIAPEKDVDGVTTASFAGMGLGLPGFASCTPGGIMRLLGAYDVPLAGAHAVVVGRSPILGKPVSLLLLGADATVTTCHSHTRGLEEIVAEADILVAAVGRPELVRGSWVKHGAVVIDAGYNAGNVGDVEHAVAKKRAALLTPVPGGVGPMTIAVLLSQTVDAAQRQRRGSRPEAGRQRW